MGFGKSGRGGKRVLIRAGGKGREWTILRFCVRDLKQTAHTRSSTASIVFLFFFEGKSGSNVVSRSRRHGYTSRVVTRIFWFSWFFFFNINLSVRGRLIQQIGLPTEKRNTLVYVLLLHFPLLKRRKRKLKTIVTLKYCRSPLSSRSSYMRRASSQIDNNAIPPALSRLNHWWRLYSQYSSRYYIWE